MAESASRNSESWIAQQWRDICDAHGAGWEMIPGTEAKLLELERRVLARAAVSERGTRDKKHAALRSRRRKASSTMDTT